ncbi:hypothetical protein FHG87_025423, partial [Trinorchestia longiramus]
LRMCMREEQSGGQVRGLNDPFKEQRVFQLETTCSKLEHQLLKLEQFLGEYGMMWSEADGAYVLQPYPSSSSTRSCSTSISSTPSSANTTPTVSPRRSPRPSRPPP